MEKNLLHFILSHMLISTKRINAIGLLTLFRTSKIFITREHIKRVDNELMKLMLATLILRTNMTTLRILHFSSLILPKLKLGVMAVVST